MRHGSLFSGIGGFDLASEWMGWPNVFHCEWNEFGQKVLKHHFPKSISYNDITKTNFTIHRGEIDILTGGFPCQPYSVAGKRKGKDDERHLWPEMLRAIREIQPTFVVAENVRGLINWNGGMVFSEVQTDLEAEGYEVTAFILPACAVNAPHRRDRVWFVAYRDSERQSNGREQRKPNEQEYDKRCFSTGNDTDTESSSSEGKYEQRQEQGELRGCNSETASDTKIKRLQGECRGIRELEWIFGFGSSYPRLERNTKWQNFPTQPPVCGGNDGIPRRLDGISFPKWRNESIKAYGNAIVPQVALQIFKAIQSTL